MPAASHHVGSRSAHHCPRTAHRAPCRWIRCVRPHRPRRPPSLRRRWAGGRRSI